MTDLEDRPRPDTTQRPDSTASAAVATVPAGRQTRQGWNARLRGHLADPFHRNAYALIANTGLTGVLGLGFWAIAARLYNDPDVGRGSALISAMTLLSGIVAINLSGTLSRFIPETGRRTRTFLLSAYALSSIAVLGLTTIFLLAVGTWGPSFELLRDPSTGVWFLVAVVAAGIFTVQDGVLVGLRSAVWVPVENVLFGIAKIVLLVLMATQLPRDGVYLAWVIPMALLLLPVNALIFGRLVPRHVARMPELLPPRPREIGKFFLGDYLGALFMFGAATLPPVLVAPFVAPNTFAYFYVAWIAGGVLTLIPTNLAASLTVEGVYEAARLATNCRAALRRAVGMLGTAAVVVGLFAPYGLALLGRGYLDAAPMLQALAFAAVPRAVIEVWVGVLRAQSRVREIARVQIASGGLAIAAVIIWLHTDTLAAVTGIERITGVGLAVLVSQVLVAMAVIPPLTRFLRNAGALAAPVSTSPEPVVDRPTDDMAVVRSAARAFWLPPPRLVPLALILTSVAAAVLVTVGFGAVRTDRMNGYGLISVLPVTVFVGLGLMTLAFVATLALHRPHRAALAAQLVAFVWCLHGATIMSSTLPRFPITWIHIGFVEYISRTGTIAGELDARFSWPGFFALAAFLLGNQEWQSLVSVAEYIPVISNLAYLLPMALLLCSLRMSWQARWLAAWLFCVLNWIGQDYFSPQGFAYLLYLIFVAGLVAWLRPPLGWAWSASSSGRNDGPLPWTTVLIPRSTTTCSNGGGPRRLRWLPASPVPGELAPTTMDPTLRSAILLLLVGVFAVATFSHQLTPFLMLAACAGLVLARRCLPAGLPLLLAVLLAGWISFLAVAYWGGHLGELLSGLGDIRGNISTSVVGRTGSGGQHLQVVTVRMALACAVFALAAVGVLRRRRRVIDDRVLLVLLLAPFVAVGLQSYGGEIALRVYLFALPAAVVLAAYAVFPEAGPARRRVIRLLLVTVGALLLVGAFLVARYGNESYEQTDAGALAAVQQVYLQQGTVTVVGLTDPPAGEAPPFLPLGFQDIERTRYQSLMAPRDPADQTTMVAELRELGPGTFLVTSRATEAYLEIAGGYPPDWGERFREQLSRSPDLRLVAANPDAVVYAARQNPGTPVPVTAPVTGTRIGSTPWTPIGVVFLVTLVALITGRELRRLRGGRVSDGCLRLLIGALSVGLALVVLERLVLLA